MGNDNSTVETSCGFCCCCWAPVNCGSNNGDRHALIGGNPEEYDEETPLRSPDSARNESRHTQNRATSEINPRPSTHNQMEEETIEAEAGLVLSPDSMDLKVDGNLQLSHDITDHLRNLTANCEEIGNEVLRSTRPFPSAYHLLLMAKAAYKDFNKGESIPDYEQKANLPEEWKLLTTAKNQETTNGYFGAAYLNASCSQVVIAYRGTKFSNLGPVWADVKGVFMNNYVSQMNSACTFADLVLSAVRRIEKERKGVRFEIFFTGHSLGGWLSQVTTFSVKYLSPVDSMFKKHSVPELELHAHAVVFDSPGCKDMLLKMADTFEVRYGDSPISLDALDITSYLSAPNRVNCCNSHVGTVFRIFPDLTNLTWKQIYNLESHSSNNILSTFDPDTGQARRDQRGKLKIQQVVDWPVISGILKTAEYKDFFEWATQLNNYNPDTTSKEYEEEIRKRRGYCPIRYQTTDYKENHRSCAVFTHYERNFLEKYQWLRGLPKHFKGTNIFDEGNNEIEEYINQKMQSFSVQKQYITSSSAEELDAFIPFVKTVTHLYPNCVRNVINVLSSIEATKRLYEIESESYCRITEKLSVQFNSTDLPYVTDFIRSVGCKALNVVVNGSDGDITSARIHNVVQHHHKEDFDTYLLLQLPNILTINKSVDFIKLLEWDQVGSILLVMECQNQADVKKLFKDIVCVLQKKRDFRMILVSKIDALTAEMAFCAVSLEDQFLKVEESGPTWDNLTIEAKRQHLSKNVVSFQSHLNSIALEAFLDQDHEETWKAIIDSETVTKLVKGVKLFIGPNVADLNEISAFYVTRTFEDELNSGDEAYREDEFLKDLDENKVHVISDKAGMGKTTVITSLSLKLKTKYPHLWIIRVNLNDCTEVLRSKLVENKEIDAKCNKNNVVEAANTIIDLMESNTFTKLSTTFEKNLFKRALLVNGNVTLFLDGYDEISPDYEELILDFLRSLMECKLQNIIIATRPHTKTKLQNQLQANSHTMKAFTEDDQKSFLVRFWQQSLRCTSHNLDLEKHSKDMIERLSSAINDDERTFTGIPLQCRLVAEVFQDRLQQGKPELPKELNLMELYDIFVTKKLKLYEVEKSVDTRGNVNAILDRRMADSAMLRYHRQVALQLILGEERFGSLGLPVLDDDLLEIRALKAGLLLGGGQVPQFIHRTIAEFFVADFFAVNLDKYNLVKVLATEVLLRPQYRIVRSFLNGKSKGLKSGLFGSHLAEAFRAERETFFDCEHQTAIFFLVRENLVDLLRFVLDCCAKDKRNMETLAPFITERNAKGLTALYHGFKYVQKDIHLPFFESLSHCETKIKRALLLASMFKQTIGMMDVYTKHLFTAAHMDLGFTGVTTDMASKFSLIPSFLDAAKRGSVEELREILELAGDDETRYYLLRAYEKRVSMSNSALHWAADRGHVEASRYLIANGAPVDYGIVDENDNTSQKWTPLDAAVLANNEEIVRMILETINNIKPSDLSLEFAMLTNNVNIYCYLFANLTGFDLGTIQGLVDPGLHKQNMLILSIRKDNSRKWENITLESLAMVKEDRLKDAVLHMLKKGATVNKPDEDGHCPIHWAVRIGRGDIVSFLIENGANVNTRNKSNGHTPLIIASSIDADQIVKMLVLNGADVNTSDNTHSTALHYSAGKGHENVVRTLLTNSANVSAVDQNNNTALHNAAEKGFTGVAIALLDNGANVEARDQGKMTAIHCASVWGHAAMVESLLERGANVMTVDKKSRTALHYACYNENVAVARILIHHGADCKARDVDMETPLHDVSHNGNVLLTTMLLEHSADVNATDSMNRTPLHNACTGGHAEMVIALLEIGATVNAVDSGHRTPLLCASFNQHVGVIKILVQHGANINSADNSGQTALHNAVRNKRLDTALYLLENGANMRAADQENVTPLNLIELQMQQGNLDFLISLMGQINSTVTL